MGELSTTDDCVIILLFTDTRNLALNSCYVPRMSRQSSFTFYFAIELLLDIEYILFSFVGIAGQATWWVIVSDELMFTIKLGEAMSVVVQVWLNWNAYVPEFQLQISFLFRGALISGYFIVAIRNSWIYVVFTQHYCYNCNAGAFGYRWFAMCTDVYRWMIYFY